MNERTVLIIPALQLLFNPSVSTLTHLFLGLDDGDVVGQRSLRSRFARWVVGQHDFHLDAQNTLNARE